MLYDLNNLKIYNNLKVIVNQIINPYSHHT